MTPAEIEAIERATLAAVAPEALEEIPGWLLPYDGGTVGRAKSAVPLQHTRPDPAVLREIEARYRARKLPAVFRIPANPHFDDLRAALARSGYTGSKPTEVQTAMTAAVQRVSDAAAFSNNWASVHGMRTAQAWRGRGLAARVLATLAAAAGSRGYPRMFLQVQADNSPARSLYRRAGFTIAWTYDYWQRP